MNKFKYLYVFIIISHYCISCANNDQSLKMIEMSYIDGFNTRYVLIGSCKDSINSAIESDFYLKKYVGTDFPNKYFLSQKSFNYLAVYINANCNKENPDEIGKQSIFTTISYFGGRKQKCYCYEQRNMIEYINGMLTWMHKGNTKDEFEALINQLTLLIENH